MIDKTLTIDDSHYKIKRDALTTAVNHIKVACTLASIPQGSRAMPSEDEISMTTLASRALDGLSPGVSWGAWSWPHAPATYTAHAVAPPTGSKQEVREV